MLEAVLRPPNDRGEAWMVLEGEFDLAGRDQVQAAFAGR